LEYASAFVSATSLDVKPRSLVLIHDPTGANATARKGILAECAQHRCSVRIHTTSVIHDRYWICDGLRALHVGASLNSLGRKRFTTMSRLAPQDLKAFLHWLGLQGFQ